MMIAGLQLTSVLLVWSLSEWESSAAFRPRARGSVYPEAWQSLRERYHVRSRWPAQYIQAVRGGNRRLKPTIRDQALVRQRPEPLGRPPPRNQFQNDRDFSRQNQRPIQTGRPQSSRLRNPTDFTLQLPFVSLQRETPPSDGGQRKRFHGPGSGSDSFRPNIDVALSLPITSRAQSKPPSRNVGNFANVKPPGPAGFIPNANKQPPALQSSLTLSGVELWSLLNSVRNLQRPVKPVQTEPAEQHKPSVVSLQFSSQHPAPPEPVIQSRVPTWQNPERPISHYLQPYDDVYNGHDRVHTKPTRDRQSGQTAPSNPTNVRPSLFDYLYRGHDGVQMSPTSDVYGGGQSGQTDVSPSQHERRPSGHHSAGQNEPSRDTYGTQEAWRPVRPRPVVSSDQYSNWFKPSSAKREETAPPSNPVQPPSLPTDAPPPEHEALPPSSNSEVPPAANSSGNTVQKMDSSSPSGQSGPAPSPGHPTAFDTLENVQSWSERQTGPAGQGSGGGQHSFAKLFLDLNDETDEGPGPAEDLTAPPQTSLYGGRFGQNAMGTPVSNPSLSDLYSGLQLDRPVYGRPPVIESGVDLHPQNQRVPEQLQGSGPVNEAPHVTNTDSGPTYFDQEDLPEIILYTMPDAPGQRR